MIIIKYSLAKYEVELVIIIYKSKWLYQNVYKSCALIEYEDGHMRAVDEDELEKIEFNYEDECGDDLNEQ